MATYIIVDKDKDPLEPGEINAGDSIEVNSGDVFIVSSSVDDDIEFESASGSSTNFSIQFDESNNSEFKVEIGDDLNANIVIADDVDIGEVEFEANKADSITLTAGDDVSIQEYSGSDKGFDTLNVGDNFSAEKIDLEDGDNSLTIGDGASVDEIKTGKGDDSITIGDGFTGDKIETKKGDDDITLGDNASVEDIKTDKGDDTVRVGDNFTGDKIETKYGNDKVVLGDNADISEVKTDKGNDKVSVGKSAKVDKLDGGKGNDTLSSQTELSSAKSFEAMVCFVRGTLIDTRFGATPIESLRIGDQVETLDHGLQTLRWVGSSRVAGTGAFAPVRIAKGALGNIRDLWVSQQHRMMLGDWRTQIYFGEDQVLVPAKHLVDDLDIRIEEVAEVEYYHMLFDQHEIVFAEGVASESFHPGAIGISAMSAATRAEIFEIFPELREDAEGFGPAARPSLKGFEGSLMTDEHRLH